MELSGEAKELNEVIVANLTGKKGTKRPIKGVSEILLNTSYFYNTNSLRVIIYGIMNFMF